MKLFSSEPQIQEIYALKCYEYIRINTSQVPIEK